MSPPATKTPKAAPAKKPAAAPAKKPAAAAKKPAPRADYGAPIDGFFARQPPALRPILEALRSLVEETVPRVEASLKWGMPFFSLNGVMMCAIGGHKAHVNLMLAGVPGVFTDPKNLLVGEGKTGRHLKLTKLEELPRDDVRRWLREAAAHARKNGLRRSARQSAIGARSLGTGEQVHALGDAGGELGRPSKRGHGAAVRPQVSAQPRSRSRRAALDTVGDPCFERRYRTTPVMAVPSTS